MRRLTYAFAAAFLIILVPTLLRKISETMIDPLLKSGLPEADIRLYRYLLALQYISARPLKDHPTLEVDRIKTFLEEHREDGARVCPLCERFYLSTVDCCPIHSMVNRFVDQRVLTHQIGIWEEFRKNYVNTTRIRGLTRVGAIRLHWHVTHKGEG